MLVLIAALLWSTTGIAGEMLPKVPPVTIGALRLVLGAAVLSLLIFLPSQRAGDWSRLDWAGRRLVVVAGFCTALFQVCFFVAVRLTGAALGPLAVLASAPVWAALIEWLVKHERPAVRWYAGTGLAVAGTGLISIAGSSISVQIGGLASAIVAGACYAGYSNSTRMLGQRGANRTWVVRITLTAGAAAISPLLFWADFSALANTRGVLIIAWLAIAGTALPYIAFVAGLKYATARTAASFGLAQPLAGTLLAVIFLHESLTVPLVIAAALLILGLVVISVPFDPGRLLALTRGRRPAIRPLRSPRSGRGLPSPADPAGREAVDVRQGR
jgi:DME family drug/metabolite transporter